MKKEKLGNYIESIVDSVHYSVILNSLLNGILLRIKLKSIYLEL